MTWSNYDDVIAAMRAEGFEVAQLDIGKKTRVKRPGHSQKGWYVLHDITLDDGKVLQLKQILELLKASPGRFLKLNEHDWLALDDSLRKRLPQGPGAGCALRGNGGKLPLEGERGAERSRSRGGALSVGKRGDVQP